MSKKYKAVKNVNRPGRPPSGCVWVKNDDGSIETNKAGELAYRPATAADQAAKAKKPGKKRGRPRKVVSASVAETDVVSVLTRKTHYRQLSYEQLEKVGGFVADLLEKQKEAERVRLEKQAEAIQAKIKALK